MKMGCCSFNELIKNASRSLIISRSQPRFIRLSSAVLSSSSNCSCDTDYNYKHEEIPSSSLLDGFIKTTKKMKRFYKRTFSEYVPSSMLVRPDFSRETAEAVHHFIPFLGVPDDCIKISVEKNKTVTIVAQGDRVFEAIKGFQKCVCYIDLPDIDSPLKYYTTRGIKANMVFQTAMLELIIPKLKQHEKQHDDQMTTFNLNLNRTFRDYKYTEEDDDDDDDGHCHKASSLSTFYASMASLLQLVRLPPIINKCLDISSQFFLSTLSDGNRHRLNIAIYSIYSFIYSNIMNRFGLFHQRVYTISTTEIKPSSSQETDEFLYYYLQLNGVTSYENVRVNVDENLVLIKGVVHDEFKATHHMYTCHIDLQPEDSWYLKYNIRDIKADFTQGQGAGKLKLIIPKFDAAQRMMNDKKNEAGEFSKLQEDAFVFNINVNASIL